MPAKKCSPRKTAPKRKPAAKRKSCTTRRASTASKPRSRSASTCRRSSAACVTGCRSPYMTNSSGKCGTVPCVDANGNPLMGYVRNSRGECAPKSCGAGYVFNYATGKCVSQNTPMGQQLLAVKKFNDAIQAKAHAQKIIDNFEPKYDANSVEEKTYGAMLGGTDAVAKAQASYRASLATMQKQRQLKYQEQLNKAYELEKQRSQLMSGGGGTAPCSTPTNPWGAFY